MAKPKSLQQLLFFGNFISRGGRIQSFKEVKLDPGPWKNKTDLSLQEKKGSLHNRARDYIISLNSKPSRNISSAEDSVPLIYTFFLS